MEIKRIAFLIERYHAGLISETELDELNNWFHSVQIGNLTIQEWIEEGGSAQQLANDSFDRFKNRIPLSSKQPSWKYAIAVAASVLVFITGAFLIYSRNKSINTEKITQTSNFKKSDRQATITLENGDIIPLEDYLKTGLSNKTASFIVKDGSVSYINRGKHANAFKSEFNTLTTPKGGTYNLTLADGTEVVLDAESSISYPTSFNGPERIVTLVGQAYFKVIHDDKQPFIVKAKGQILRDIGTEFNVNAYAEDLAMEATLIEGSISVSNASHTKILIPGERASVKNNDSNISVTKPILADVLAWTKGSFSFRHQQISDILRQASRWYDIEVIYDGKIPDKTFGGKINRQGNVRELLESLRIISGIQYRLEGRRVIIMN